jgi:starvation-inducible DNA-binding protein
MRNDRFAMTVICMVMLIYKGVPMKKLFVSSNNLPVKIREKVVARLELQLATLVDLQSQLHQAHWNVKGAHFISYHKLFEDLAAGLAAHIDIIAERLTALGGFAVGSVAGVAARSTLKELPHSVTKDTLLVNELRSRYKLVAAEVHKAIQEFDDLDDDGTEDIMITLSAEIDKALWYLDATLSR